MQSVLKFNLKATWSSLLRRPEGHNRGRTQQECRSAAEVLQNSRSAAEVQQKCCRSAAGVQLAPFLCKVRLRKSTRESMQKRSREGPGSNQNRAKIGPGTFSGRPEAPRASRRRLGSVSGASRGIPGAPRERPEGPQGCPGTPTRASRSARECAEATKIDAKSRPGATKSSFLRAARSRSTVGAIFRRFVSISGFFAKSANPLKYCAC
jgi:hypothetical protein